MDEFDAGPGQCVVTYRSIDTGGEVPWVEFARDIAADAARRTPTAGGSCRHDVPDPPDGHDRQHLVPERRAVRDRARGDRRLREGRLRVTRYPFVPRSNVHLEPGQFWSVPLPDGRFGCGRVLAIDRSGAYGARTLFTGALHDWVGTDVPTSAAIAGSPVIAIGRAHVRVIADGGGEVLGLRPLGGDGIEVPDQVSTFWGPASPGHALRDGSSTVIRHPPPRSASSGRR